MHLSKPHDDEGVLVVNVVNPTAGLLAGDRIDCRVRVETRSAAAPHHAERESRASCIRWAMRSWCRISRSRRAGGWMSGPSCSFHKAARATANGRRCGWRRAGKRLFFETLAPGRVAMGEAFAYRALDWETDILLGGELIARERYRLTPDERQSCARLRAQFADRLLRELFCDLAGARGGIAVLAGDSRTARCGCLDRLQAAAARRLGDQGGGRRQCGACGASWARSGGNSTRRSAGGEPSLRRTLAGE